MRVNLRSTPRSQPVDDGAATRVKRPMPRPIKQTPAGLLEHEFAQERASALGRLGRALEAALAALAELDAASPPNEAASAQHRRGAHRWWRRRASRSGTSSCSVKRAGCATCVTCCATIACRPRSPPAWACCPLSRPGRASAAAGLERLPAPILPIARHASSPTALGPLVWRFRSPHHSCGQSEMRTSEPKPH